MRALIPALDDNVDVHGHYASGWLDRGGIRANFVCSVDGAVHSAGVSRGLQTRGDNTVFGVLRDLADVVLVGAGTAVAEVYAPARFSERRRGIRRELGLRASMPVAVLSRTLRLDPNSPLFADATSEDRTIVLTCAAADHVARRALQRVADVVECGDEMVDSVLLRRALEERGLTRILSEGGPTVFGGLVRDGVVNELCLSVTPLLVGAGPGRIVNGRDWPAPEALSLAGMLEDDSALFLRYAIRPQETT
ncbi:MAG: dihydrofolate reductase family protein [Jatrophihabitans sp.]